MNTLKEIYNLEYDKSNFHSGLIKWYDELIDKTIDELDVTDVSKMVRQNILKDTAITIAIDLFIKDPFYGEMSDGDLLSLIVMHGSEIVKRSNRRNELCSIVNELKLNNYDYDWLNESDKIKYKQNVAILDKLIAEY